MKPSLPPRPTDPSIPPRPSSKPSVPKRPSQVSLHTPQLKPSLPPRPGSNVTTSAPKETPPTAPPRPNSFQSPLFPPRPKSAKSVCGIDDINSWHVAASKLSASHAIRLSPNEVAVDSEDKDFSAVDSFAIGTPPSETHSLNRLARYLSHRFVSNVDKLRAIFCWVANNIAYDYLGFIHGRAGPQDAESVLRNRSSVCEGYANIFLELVKASDCSVEVRKVTGAARGVGVMPGDPVIDLNAHAWNAVLLDGEYRFIECTWAAGNVDASGFTKKYRPAQYFLVHPKKFIYTHIPRKDSFEQFLTTPLSHAEWAALPAMHAIAAYPNDLRLVSTNGFLTENSLCLLSYLEIKDNYLEIKLEVDRYKFVGTGGVVLADVTPGILVHPAAVSAHSAHSNGNALFWVESAPHQNSIQNAGGTSYGLIFHTELSPIHGKLLCVIRGHIPKGEFLCNVKASIDPNINLYFDAISFRIKSTGQAPYHAPPKTFSGSVRIVGPLKGRLAVGETVLFQAQSETLNAIVITPGKKLLQMRPTQTGNGMQELKVHVDSPGEWVVGSGDWKGYAFAAQYIAH